MKPFAFLVSSHININPPNLSSPIYFIIIPNHLTTTFHLKPVTSKKIKTSDTKHSFTIQSSVRINVVSPSSSFHQATAATLPTLPMKMETFFCLQWLNYFTLSCGNIFHVFFSAQLKKSFSLQPTVTKKTPYKMHIDAYQHTRHIKTVPQPQLKSNKTWHDKKDDFNMQKREV